MRKLVGLVLLGLTLWGGHANATGSHSVRHLRSLHHHSVTHVVQTSEGGYVHTGSMASGNNARPRAWCGWQMRQWFGGGSEYNLARNWAKRGTATTAHIGAVVVWPHHVGYITGRDARGEWIVKSGNDGHRVRERPRSLAGTIAIRQL